MDEQSKKKLKLFVGGALVYLTYKQYKAYKTFTKAEEQLVTMQQTYANMGLANREYWKKVGAKDPFGGDNKEFRSAREIRAESEFYNVIIDGFTE